MIGYEALTWGLWSAEIAARRCGWTFAAGAAQNALDAISWKAPEVRRAMVRQMVHAWRHVGRHDKGADVPPEFYRFLAACLLVSIREGGAW